MSDLWPATGREVAVLVGDWHFTLTAPPARAEKDWLKVQEGYAGQLLAVKNHFAEVNSNFRIVSTGDLFDSWNPPPELINFALKVLPYQMFSVAGNHDLPNNDYGQIQRSAYYTLCLNDAIHNLDPGRIHYLNKDWDVVGFPWGCYDEKPKCRGKKTLAVIHDYCWSEGNEHPGAPPEKHVHEFQRRFHQYTTLAIGDQHEGHYEDAAQPNVFLNGAFLRRRSDERDYQPRVGVLMDDGSVRTIYLDTSKDEFQEVDPKVEAVGIDADELLKSVRSLADVGLDFKEAVAAWLRRDKPLEKVEKFALDWLERKK